MLDIIDELQIQTEFDKFWDNGFTKSSTMKMVKNYLDMVMSMLPFTRSVRSADCNLRLSALENFTNYFFAMDLRNYLPMCAWHLAEMMHLQISDPEVWNELNKGIWVPNKSNIYFCSLRADEALEQEI